MSPELQPLGRALIIIGLILVVIGLVLTVVPKVPWLGQLPGDIVIRRDRMTFYFPIATSFLISFFLSLLFWLWSRFR